MKGTGGAMPPVSLRLQVLDVFENLAVCGGFNGGVLPAPIFVTI
ncbi:hypothetical protein [Starkeya sp. ORNL1]|nr:hypothetical protein [Starkeya sp. ORNL1]